MEKQIKAYKFHFILYFKYHLLPLKDFHPFQSNLKLNCPLKTEWRDFSVSELSTVLTEAKQELHQGPGGPPCHAFPQVGNLIFVAHHTRDV